MTLSSSDSIFEEPSRLVDKPLAARLRPKSISEIVGHRDHLRPEGSLGAMVFSKRLRSLVISGPPGVGKTTIARVLAGEADYRFVPLVATSLGVKEIKEASASAEKAFEIQGVRSVVFIDELHRLTRVQSDSLLLPVEEGTFVLIGATTENPWMELSPALLSRLLVVELSSLGKDEVEKVIDRAERIAGCSVSEAGRARIFVTCGGDLRSVINTFEGASSIATARAKGGKAEISEEDVLSVKRTVSGGLSSTDHYEMTSALIKSMRASDVNAALYWLARLLVAGEDPRFIARRLLIFASEDVGLADSNALAVASAAMQAAERIGMPEVRINLGHCVSYLSLADKSRASYNATNMALGLAERTIGRPVPQQLRGTVTKIEASRGKTPDSKPQPSRFPKGVAKVEFLKPEEM